jgi:hypothetical protein
MRHSVISIAIPQMFLSSTHEGWFFQSLSCRCVFHCTSGGHVGFVGRHCSIRDGSTRSLPLLVSPSHGTQPFPPLSLARSSVAQTSTSTRARRVATCTSISLACHRSLPPLCSSLCRVGPPRVLLKSSRPAMLSCWRVNNRWWPSKRFQLTLRGLHADALAL